MPSWLPFEWITALRFLREGRIQTPLIVIGVAIGVAVIVFMSALLTGVQTNMLRRVLSAQAHIALQPPDETARPLREGEGTAALQTVQRPSQRTRSIDQWQALRRELEMRPDIRVVAPVASGPGIALRGDASRSVSVIGIEPESYFRIVAVPPAIIAGSTRLAAEDALIGTDLARELGVALGDKLRLSTAAGREIVVTVSGIFDLGSRGINQRNVYVALRTGQTLHDLPGGVSELDLTVVDIYAAERIAGEIVGRAAVQANSWIRTNEQFFVALNAQLVSNTAIRFFVGLSVAFGIASVLAVSVIQRSREIGILRAIGTSRGQIMRLFLIQGGLVGLAGSLVGSALGGGALLLWDLVARAADGSPLFKVELEPGLVGASALLATLTGIAAAVGPARRAARLDPVVAIRA